MIKNKKGLIANILSAVVYHSFPGVSAYFSAKSALGAIHEALNIELAGTPVKTLYIRPGGYLSNYWKNTEIGSRIQDFKYPPLHDLRDPKYLANRIFKAIEQEKVEVQIGSWKDRLGYHMSYWAPKFLDRIIAGKNKQLIQNKAIRSRKKSIHIFSRNPKN